MQISGNLRNMAIDMGSELNNQNRMIDRINAKVILTEMIHSIKSITDEFTMSFDIFRANRTKQE